MTSALVWCIVGSVGGESSLVNNLFIFKFINIIFSYQQMESKSSSETKTLVLLSAGPRRPQACWHQLWWSSTFQNLLVFCFFLLLCRLEKQSPSIQVDIQKKNIHNCLSAALLSFKNTFMSFQTEVLKTQR